MKRFVHNAKEKMSSWWQRQGTVCLVLLGVVGIDRLTKWLAQAFLVEKPVAVFPFFHLHYVENTGAAFGMMQGRNWILIFVMAAIIGYLLASWNELCAQGKWGCVLILAGACGNLYDRIRLGYVVDFLDFLIWPVFNVADSAITVGGCLCVISLLLHRNKKQEE